VSAARSQIPVVLVTKKIAGLPENVAHPVCGTAGHKFGLCGAQ